MVIRILVAAALAAGATASPLLPASAAYGDPRKGCATGDSAIPPVPLLLPPLA